MNHGELQSRLSEYIEGDLPLAERARFDAHLEECQPCGRELQALRRTVDMLRSLPDFEAPAGLVDEVMRRVRADAGALPWFEKLRSAFAWPNLAAPVSALAACLLVLFVTGRIEMPPVELYGPATPMLRGESVLAEPGTPRSGAGPGQIRPGTPAWSPVETVAGPYNSSSDRLPLAARSPSSLMRPGPADPVQPRSAATAGVAGAASETRDWAERRRLELDRRLNLLLRTPAVFAQELSMESQASRELLLVELAERAVNIGRADEVVAALSHSEDVDALALLESFSGSVKRAQASSKAR